MILSFINQKGGAAKTTTALNVGAALTRKGYKVLIIDLDPQGNLTTAAGMQPQEVADVPTVYEVLTGNIDINETIRTTAGGYDLIPTDIRQSGVEIELSAATGRDFILREAIENIKPAYDYILLDCPPSLSIITIMALTACDEVIIPIQGQYYALQGTRQLMNTFEVIQKRTNPRIKICGVVVTIYDGRKLLDRDILENVRAAFGAKVFNTQIRNNVSLAEAPAFGQDIYLYKPDSTGAADYTALTDEIIERTKKE